MYKVKISFVNSADFRREVKECSSLPALRNAPCALGV